MIYHDMPFKQYCELDALNASTLKNFYDSAIKCKYKMDKPDKPTKSLNFGTMVHKWVLEHEDFESEYVTIEEDDIKLYKKFEGVDINLSNIAIHPDDYRKNTKVYKEWLETVNGQEPMKESEYKKLEQVLNLRTTINKRIPVTPEEMDDLSTIDLRIEGMNECTVTWKLGDIDCKSRFDSIVDGEIYDVKTSAGAYSFEREITKYKYWLQAGFYWLAYEAEFGEQPKAFNFVVIPNSMPYNDYIIYEMDLEYVKFGVEKVLEYAPLFAHCKEKNQWPSRGVARAYKPAWLV